MMPVVQVPNEILQMSVDDQMEFITKIWESFAEDCVMQPLSNAHERILDQRVAEADAGPGGVNSNRRSMPRTLG